MTDPSYLPPPPPPKNSRKTLIIALVVVVVVVAAIVGAYLLTRSGASNPPIGTPTPTPTATVSPSVTPTPSTEPVPILSKTAFIQDGYYTIVGEVKNNLGTNVEYVKIVATFYDSSSTVIGTSYAYTQIDILKPSQKSPFEISSYPDEITPASYKLSVQYDVTSEMPFQGLDIISHTPSTDSAGYYHIVGELKNNGASTSTYVMIVATYYNSAGTVIGTSYTYAELDEINVGATSPFELNSYPQKITPARYELQAQD